MCNFANTFSFQILEYARYPGHWNSLIMNGHFKDIVTMWQEVICILLVFSERCILWRKFSNANNVGSNLNVLPLCRRTSWSTRTPDRTRVSTAENASTRSQTWRNTPTSTQVSVRLTNTVVLILFQSWPSSELGALTDRKVDLPVDR